MMKTNSFLIFFTTVVALALSATGARAQLAAPQIIAQGDPSAPAPMGDWQGHFGQCAWILSGYNSMEGCEQAILQNATTAAEMPTAGSGPVGCPGGGWRNGVTSYIGGVNQDQTDCADLNAEGVFASDIAYRVYVGPNPYDGPGGEAGVGFGRTLVAEDSCAPVPDAAWAGSPGLSYDINGMAPGSYRMSVYVMDPDATACEQDIQVHVGSTPAPLESVVDDAAGVYQQYLVDVVDGSTNISVEHSCSSGSSGVAVVQGVFFDQSSTAASTECGSSVCSVGQDRETGGNWSGVVGEAGALLFNRNSTTDGGPATAGGVLKLNFTIAPATIVPDAAATSLVWRVPTAMPDWWKGGRKYTAEQCGTAMAWTWDADTTGTSREGFALENPGSCLVSGSVRPASTYDDAGERGFKPNLRFDIDIPPDAYWLTAYFVDFDAPHSDPDCRQQSVQIYPYRDFSAPLFAAVDPIESGLFPDGFYLRYPVQGGANGTRVSLEISTATSCSNAILSGVFLDPLGRTSCEGGGSPPGGGTPPSGDPPPVSSGPFCSQTPGGWGAPPNGSNPGKMLVENADAILPITIGDGIANECSNDTMTFGEPTVVEDFLPHGGKASTFCSGGKKGKNKGAGVLAGHLLAAKINVAFSDAGIKTKPSGDAPDESANSGLGDLVLQSCSQVDGPLVGKTVDELIALADQAISGGNTGGLKLTAISEALAMVNEGFHECVSATAFASGCLVEPNAGGGAAP